MDLGGKDNNMEKAFQRLARGIKMILDAMKIKPIDNVIAELNTQNTFVKVKGKTYFRHSEFFDHFEKSEHNHWVYQLFSFDKNGVMKCSNADFGEKFPAVTIYYIKPKFRQIELTAGDLKKIADGTKPVAK